MSNYGLGVLIQMLGGNESTVEAIKKSLGSKITSVKLNNDVDDGQVEILFKNGTQLNIRDSGRSCCENRYITTDDNLSYFTNCTLKDVELRDHQLVKESEYGDANEIMFLDIVTTKGRIQFVTHNEHNGYYGGFWVTAELVEPN